MSKRAFGFTRLFIVLAASVAVTCDSFQEDLIQDPIKIDFSATDYYIIPKSSTIIDLQSLISSSFNNLTLNVAENPTRGNLKALNEFLFQYEPLADFTEGTDQMKITVTSSQGVIKKINVTIHMELNSSQLPCGLTVEDLVCSNSKETIPILFLANDQTCDISKENIQVSIFLAPEHGSAILKGDTIFYTPADGNKAADQMIYKLVTKAKSTVTSYGVISIPGSTQIQFEVTAKNVNEGNIATIAIPFTERIACNGSVRVKVTGDAVYSKLYTTFPKVENDSIEIPVLKGQTSAQIIVTTIDNELLEKSKTVTFTLVDPDDGFLLGVNNSTTLTIGDDEGPALVNFAVNEGDINENDESGATIQIPLSSFAKGEGTISIQLESGQAVYGTNFTTVPAAAGNLITLHVANKDTITTFKVLPTNNDLFKGNFKQIFSISAVSGVLEKGNNLTYSLTVKDDELPSIVNFVANKGSVNENSSEGIAVHLPFSSPAKGDGSISITINSGQAVYGTDFTTIPAASGNSINLPVVHGETEASFTVLPVDDAFFKGDHELSISINGVTGVVSKGDNLVYSLTIKEDDELKFSAASFEITGWGEPNCDDFGANCTQEPISEGAVSEIQSSGIVVPILFSEPANSKGTITITWINQGSYCGYAPSYGTAFTTSPSPKVQGGSSIVLNVDAGDVGSSFTILPIDNELFGEVPVSFNISSVSGAIKKGESLNYTLKIIDDEVPSVANFKNPDGPISEGDPIGLIVEIPFSKPTDGSGSVTVSTSSDYGYFYRTEPAFTPDPTQPHLSTITFNVGPGETGVSFKVIPIHNVYCPDYGLRFWITSCGFVKTGDKSYYQNFIRNIDPTSVVNFAENEGVVNENNASGIIVKVNLSAPAPHDATLYFYPSEYNGNYTTNPPITEGFNDLGGTEKFVPLDILKNATSAQFTVLPVDNANKSSNYSFNFIMWPPTIGCLLIDPDAKYKLTILDDD